ncbi:hypothetical protein PUN4_340009 [Paraburkholderia unamae]|nr:hypothetical protein PUN4_340009 [Paraburkholderia unamae]
MAATKSDFAMHPFAAQNPCKKFIRGRLKNYNALPISREDSFPPDAPALSLSHKTETP